MTSLIDTTVKLSQGQQTNLRRAVNAGRPISLRIDPKNPISVAVSVTRKNYNKGSGGKGYILELGAAEIKHMRDRPKTGGFAWLAPLASAVALPLASKLGVYAGEKAVGGLKKIFGHGTQGSGLYMAGDRSSSSNINTAVGRRSGGSSQRLLPGAVLRPQTKKR